MSSAVAFAKEPAEPTKLCRRGSFLYWKRVIYHKAGAKKEKLLCWNIEETPNQENYRIETLSFNISIVLSVFIPWGKGHRSLHQNIIFSIMWLRRYLFWAQIHSRTTQRRFVAFVGNKIKKMCYKQTNHIFRGTAFTKQEGNDSQKFYYKLNIARKSFKWWTRAEAFIYPTRSSLE